MGSGQSIGFGIIGCGRVVERRVIPAVAESRLAHIAACCSRDIEKARRFAAGSGGAAFDSLDTMLADERVQAVYVALPNHLHAETAIRCLHAGRHVLIDKPMAMSAVEAKKIVDAATEAGRITGVLHQQRFHPANARLIEMVRRGELGRLGILRVQIGFWYPPSDNWRLCPELSGGGPGMDLGPHALDLMLQIGGPIVEVDARTANVQFDYAVEDFCGARVRFESGAIGLVDLSYASHDYGGRIEAFGSEATCIVDGSMQQVERVRTRIRRGDRWEPPEETAGVGCFGPAMDDFAGAIGSGRKPAVGMEDGLTVMRVIDAMYESARLKRAVPVVN